MQQDKTSNSTFFQWNEFGPSAGLTAGLGSVRVSLLSVQVHAWLLSYLFGQDWHAHGCGFEKMRERCHFTLDWALDFKYVKRHCQDGTTNVKSTAHWRVRRACGSALQDPHGGNSSHWCGSLCGILKTYLWLVHTFLSPTSTNGLNHS